MRFLRCRSWPKETQLQTTFRNSIVEYFATDLARERAKITHNKYICIYGDKYCCVCIAHIPRFQAIKQEQQSNSCRKLASFMKMAWKKVYHIWAKQNIIYIHMHMYDIYDFMVFLKSKHSRQADAWISQNIYTYIKYKYMIYEYRKILKIAD